MDAKHGATIRNSWSIDESDELGRLEFGVSLKYDAVSTGNFPISQYCTSYVVYAVQAYVDVRGLILYHSTIVSYCNTNSTVEDLDAAFYTIAKSRNGKYSGHGEIRYW